MIPARGLLLVAPIETDERMPGGRILLVADTRERMTANQCEVIAVGAPAECDPTRSRAERKCERLHDVTHDMDGKQGGCFDINGLMPGRCMRFHPCPVRVGDWIVVRPRAYVASDIEKRWFVKQDDVLAILNEE